jgi:putative ABC transport system permease protein
MTVLEILGIALLLSSVAGIVSTTQITKYEPIKILMERN